MRKHPQLAEKLKLLFTLRINPEINNNADLAKRLGISRQAISKWVRGTETSLGNEIPHNQLEKLASLFRIDSYWFTLSLPEYELRLRDVAERNNSIRSSVPDKVSLSLLPITQTEIFGRDLELDLLDRAWDDDQTNLVQVIAFGGVGKSALINAWLSRMAARNYLGASKVYAWSFSWQGGASEVLTTGDNFVEHALEWFGDENPTSGTPWAKATRLANLIRSSRCLLILDGLEPLQNPPGPKAGLIENPAIALLIKELATINPGLCLITSRLPATDLTPYLDGRVCTINLQQLTIEAGTKLLKHSGVHGSEADFSLAVATYAGHPLSLSLLGGYLKVVFDGAIGKFREIDSLFNERDQSAHTRNLMRNYLNWFEGKPESAIVNLIGLFDRAISVEELRNTVQSGQIVELSDQLAGLNLAGWTYALRNLETANLITFDRRNDSHEIDCHPLVRDYLSEVLGTEKPEVWKSGHSVIFRNLLSSAAVQPETLEDIELLFRAVIHGTEAGLYEEAFSIYSDRIKQGYVMLTQGSHYTDYSCLRNFFEGDWSTPVRSLRTDTKYLVMSSAATNLMTLGEIFLSMDLCNRSIKWFVENERWLDAAALAGPFLSMLIASGELRIALPLIKELGVCVENSNNVVIKAMSSTFLAYASFLGGETDRAKVLFEQADAVLKNYIPESPVSFPTISSYYCKFLLDSGHPKEALERSLTTFGWRERKSWQVSIDTTSLLATDMMVLGLVFLKLGDLINAKIYLDRQIELLKQADEWLYLPTGLNYRARYFITTKEYDLAENDLEAALSISLKTGARFEQWESYLSYTSIYLEKGDKRTAKQYLLKALELPGMDMYKFRDSELDQLKSALGTVSASRKSSKGSPRTGNR